MRKILLLTIVSFQIYFLNAQQVYKFELDLINIEKDKAKVTLTPPKTEESTLVFQLPDVIPGSYMFKQYGRFVKSFKAYDNEGNKIKVKVNKKDFTFTINNPQNLSKIEYYVKDSWDDGNKKNYIFQPGGTDIEENKVFVINHFGFFGYFSGFENLPYEVTIKKPETLYGSTALKDLNPDKRIDVFNASSYFNLSNKPILYAIADTLSFKIDNTTFYISSYSRNNKITSNQLKDIIEPVLNKSMKTFFGKFPMDEYHFQFFFSSNNEEKITKNGGFGALEQNNSSFYFLPEFVSKKDLKETVSSVVSHEFLHTFTPLNFCSEIIKDFKFNNAVMSKHLWLYEGVTEYFSNLMLLRDSIITMDDFKKEIRRKLIAMDKQKSYSLTEMSKNVLSDKFKDSYEDIYSRGAIIAFLLDIRLNEISNGEMNLYKLLFTLQKKYKGNVFNEDSFFDDLIEASYPEIKVFIDDFIISGKQLPIKEYFSKIGWDYNKTLRGKLLSFGKIGFIYNEKDGCFYTYKCKPKYNTFGISNGIKFIKINGERVTLDNIDELAKLLIEPANFDVVALELQSRQYKYTKKAAPRKFDVEFKHKIDDMEKPQKKLGNKLFYNRD